MQADVVVQAGACAPAAHGRALPPMAAPGARDGWAVPQTTPVGRPSCPPDYGAGGPALLHPRAVGSTFAPTGTPNARSAVSWDRPVSKPEMSGGRAGSVSDASRQVDVVVNGSVVLAGLPQPCCPRTGTTKPARCSQRQAPCVVLWAPDRARWQAATRRAGNGQCGRPRGPWCDVWRRRLMRVRTATAPAAIPAPSPQELISGCSPMGVARLVG